MGQGRALCSKILLGEEELDRGEVLRHPKLRLGYLRQHDAFLPDETVLEFLMRDSEQPDWRCGEVAAEFELKGAYLDGPVGKLSGGWQTRVKLAALLLHSPNLLLLDEPTNFLDLRTQILLEHFLRHYDEACLIVSHDRAFLGATCDHTLELSRGKLTMYPGKIDAYRENQKERRKQDERVNAGVLAKKKHLEEFIAKNKARASTATRAKSKEKQLEKLETVEIATEEPRVNIRAPQVEPRRGAALRCIDLAIGYPERQIASGIGVEVVHGDRDGDRGGQRAGENDLPADDRGLVEAARRRGPLGPRLHDRDLRPACLHQLAPEADGVRIPGKYRRPPAPRPRRFSTARPRCCSAARTSRRRSRFSPVVSGHGFASRV